MDKSILTFEITPERSLGCDQWEFVLGMHFSQTVAIIQSQIGIIKGVQVLYSDSKPLDLDLVIDLPQDGIRLFFDPISQRLKIILVYNLKSVILKYCGITFNSDKILPTIQQIEHSFGATHPGEYDAEKQVFTLNFRGLSFYFPVESKYQKGSTHNLASLQFPPGSSPVVSRLAIYSGAGVDQAYAPELPLACYQGQLYLRKAEVLRSEGFTKGLKLHILTGTNNRIIDSMITNLEKKILLGQSVQDISLALGSPSRVFYKSEDKMKIHSLNVNRRICINRSDYFFNYFTLGLDILFDAHTHIAKKFILHTNYPGHYNFNTHLRCEFELPLMKNGGQIVTAYTKWKEICNCLTPSERPVVFNRGNSTNTTNPFGSTLCYGYQDIIFEVMPNNYIASLTIYGDGKQYHYPLSKQA